jgi:hypothetical protein
MNDTTFWRIIGLLDWDQAGDDDAVLEPATVVLASHSVEEIYAFDELLAEKLYALDTREVARGVYRGQLDPDDGDQYISSDDFLYSRCVIVANGRDYYQAVLADPSQAPQEMEFESLLSLARSAYEAKTGAEYDHLTRVSWESFSNAEGWKPTAQTQPGVFTSDAVPPGNRRPT